MERYKLRDFSRWAMKEGISDKALCDTLAEMKAGLLGDRLGGHIYKKRISLAGRGKRGGARMIVLFQHEELAVFIYGYSKNDKADLSLNEEEALRLFAKEFIKLSIADRFTRADAGVLVKLQEAKS